MVGAPSPPFGTASPVFETFWRFAAARQDIYIQRISGLAPPWTSDVALRSYRFTNTYRVLDRASQFLIRHVILSGDQSPSELVFRILLFKLFNSIGTWAGLAERLTTICWSEYNSERYGAALADVERERRHLYSGAYVMPPPNLGQSRKYLNHLRLIEIMMDKELPSRLSDAPTMRSAFELLRSFPSIGDFLAYQLLIDLNYSDVIDFSEMDFVVAGPGARDGIAKCFSGDRAISNSDVIRWVAEIQDDAFARLGLKFGALEGRPLQLIDCQNLFCEVDKYARLKHPEYRARSGRFRLKRRFAPSGDLEPPCLPRKWSRLSTPKQRDGEAM